ncbi:hypothetical protein M0802_000932 [Mischocyttarus mexicanus]|nr:hypothetical protein M0802_000932 [Mischocyttarus mexicanus]
MAIFQPRWHPSGGAGRRVILGGRSLGLPHGTQPIPKESFNVPSLFVHSAPITSFHLVPTTLASPSISFYHQPLPL